MRPFKIFLKIKSFCQTFIFSQKNETSSDKQKMLKSFYFKKKYSLTWNKFDYKVKCISYLFVKKCVISIIVQRQPISKDNCNLHN